MAKRKKIIWSISVVFIVIIVFFSGLRFNNWIEWKMTEKIIAGSAYPVEAGIIGVNLIPCFTTGDPPICEGGTLCYTKDAGTCLNYTDVAGMGAYSSGAGVTNLLLSKPAIGAAGLSPGGQLIAGCMSPILCDNGPLASAGGCYNCIAKTSFKDRMMEKIKFVIAGFK